MLITLRPRSSWQEAKAGVSVPPELLASVHPEIVECLRDHKPIPRRLKEEAAQEISYTFFHVWLGGIALLH